MVNDTADVTTPTDYITRESNPMDQLISTFLTARSGVYRELAELREEVSELMARRLFAHNRCVVLDRETYSIW